MYSTLCSCCAAPPVRTTSLPSSNSVCLSADVTAAYDPSWANAFEPQNGTYAGRGVAFFKYTGSRGKSSASDANAELVGDITRLLDANDVAWQIGELGRLDLGGGGTIAKYVANRGIPVLDIGVPVLSMHSPFEVIHKTDLYMAYRTFCTVLPERGIRFGPGMPAAAGFPGLFLKKLDLQVSLRCNVSAEVKQMNIKQASEQSGVSAPNIRFYEKEGLLTPARRQGNDYRDYTAGDVRTLKLIRMLRMLDVPLPTIKAVLRGEQPLQQALQAQQTVLEQQAAQLAAAMQFCADLARQAAAGGNAGCGCLPDPDGKACRSRVRSAPAGCRITARWRRCSIRSTFSFIPQGSINTPQEFTAALQTYAEEQRDAVQP